MKAVCGVLLFCLTYLQGVHAEERIELDETTVIGNRELPRVTYIIPWQAAPLPEAEEPSLDHLIDEALRPLDRDEFRRRISHYYETAGSTRDNSQSEKATK